MRSNCYESSRRRIYRNKWFDEHCYVLRISNDHSEHFYHYYSEISEEEYDGHTWEDERMHATRLTKQEARRVLSDLRSYKEPSFTSRIKIVKLVKKAKTNV